jgi:hypothetical protein
MSKEHTLSDAIEYIKKLQNQVHELQQQLDESPDDAWDKQGSASCSESVAAAAENTQCQVRTATFLPGILILIKHKSVCDFYEKARAFFIGWK